MCLNCWATSSLLRRVRQESCLKDLLLVPAIRLWACLHSSSLSSRLTRRRRITRNQSPQAEGNLFLSLLPPPGQSPASLILFPAAFRFPQHPPRIHFPKGMFIALCERSLRVKRGTRHSTPPGSVLCTNEKKHQIRKKKRGITKE